MAGLRHQLSSIRTVAISSSESKTSGAALPVRKRRSDHPSSDNDVYEKESFPRVMRAILRGGGTVISLVLTFSMRMYFPVGSIAQTVFLTHHMKSG